MLFRANQQNKFLAAALVTALLGLPINIAYAGVAACKTVNEVKTIAGKEVTCAKVQGKLNWKPSKTGIPEIKLDVFTPIPDGFSLQILDFDEYSKYEVTSTTGSAVLDEYGLIEVTGDLNQSGVLTIKYFKGKLFRKVQFSGEAFKLRNLVEPAVSPKFTQNRDGIDVEILNFDPDKKWEITSDSGDSYIHSNGIATIHNITKPGQVSYIITVSADGFKSTNKKFSFTMPNLSVIPSFGAIENKNPYSFTFQITNYDSAHKWKVSSSVGQAQINNSGTVMVSGLNPNQTSIVTVTSSIDGALEQSAEISGTSSPVFLNITERDWALIAKDPNGNLGKYIVVYGYVTQFDAATGLGQFRADVNGVNTRTSYGFSGDNTFLSGSESVLRNFVAKDYFVAKVVVRGVKTYTSTLNSSISVPLLEIVEINRN